MSAAAFLDWSSDPAYMSSLARYMLPPHEFDRPALIAAITRLVGPVDQDSSAEAFAAEVADAIHDEMRLAKTGDALVRFEVDRVLQAAGAPDEVDVSWVPGRALTAFRRLRTHDPVGADRLQQSLAGRALRDELRSLVAAPPRWLREASVETWRAVGRLAEVLGLWNEATIAWEEVAERPGADRPHALVVAAGAAESAGDGERAQRLREKARELNPAYPLLLLLDANRTEDAQERLGALEAIAPPADDDQRSMWLAARALVLLELDNQREAHALAAAAQAASPTLHAREALALAVLERNRKLRRAGRATERDALQRVAEEYEYLRDALRESHQFAKSGWMVQRVAESLTLADRPDLALEALTDVRDEELASEDVLLALAQAALNAGDPDGAERFFAAYRGDDPGAELMRAHVALRDPSRRGHGVEVLDRRVLTEDYEAAVIRMLAAVPATDEVGWSEEAEAIVRGRDSALASFIKSEWLERRGRTTAARRELARHADDPRALRELAVRFADQGEWDKAAAHARALLATEPPLDARVVAAQILLHAGVLTEAETILRGVLDSEQAHDEERRTAFEELGQTLIQAGRHADLLRLAEEGKQAGIGTAGWLAAYALAREDRLPEARRHIEGLTPRHIGDAQLAADLHLAVDPPGQALRSIIALADNLDPPDETVEVKATLALLRAAADDVTPDLVARAGPDSFVKRFPDSTVLRAQKIPETEQGLIDLLRELTETRRRLTAEAELRILEVGDWPVGTLANAAGKTLAEIWALLPALPLAYGDEREAQDEAEVARHAAGGPVVLDTGALYVLQLLGGEVLAALVAEYPLSRKAQATLDDLMQATALDTVGAQDVLTSVAWDARSEAPVTVEVSARKAAGPRDAVASMRSLARRFQTEPAHHHETRQGRDPDEEEVGSVVRTYTETVGAAQHLRAPIYSDDRAFRRSLASEGIQAFGSLALLAHLHAAEALTDNAYRVAVARLRARHALGLSEADEPQEESLLEEVQRLASDEKDRAEVTLIQQEMAELRPPLGD